MVHTENTKYTEKINMAITSVISVALCESVCAIYIDGEERDFDNGGCRNRE
jgi:hypothetical protein